MKSFIYALIDPLCPDRIRYIGMTTRNPNRPTSHAKNARRKNAKLNYLVHWIRALQAEGREPAVIILEEFGEGTAIEVVCEAEMEFISVAKERGHELTNLTIGGDGVRGYKWTDEDKQRQSEITRAYYVAHPEIKQRLGEYNRHKFKDPAERAAVGDRFRGVIPSAETKQKVIEGLRRAFANPILRENQSLAILGRKRSESTKEKLRKPKSEAHRAALRAAWARRKAGFRVAPRLHVRMAERAVKESK